jgi:hypothetical protein
VAAFYGGLVEAYGSRMVDAEDCPIFIHERGFFAEDYWAAD